MAMTVPERVRYAHTEAANALGYFAVVLRSMLHYVNDPFASLALLETYNQAEEHIYRAFDNLSIHFAATPVASHEL